MKATEQECLDAIDRVHYDSDAEKLLKMLVKEHFSMIAHMKETSLYDVYEYEDRLAKNCIEPMRMLAFDNERLKKEVNKLRRQLGKIEKYKENI